MSLTFYYAPMSTASVTEAVLAELGIPCERVKLDLKAGDARKPAFLAINPNGCVPTIVHDGTAIWESSAITMYLGEAFGVDAGLYPAPGPRRGEAMKWIAWGAVTFSAAAMRFSGASRGADAAAVAKATGDLAACLAVLDGALAGKAFLLGEYSLVDAHLQGFIGWLAMMHADLAPYANVRAWAERCQQRPALAKMMAG